MPFLTYGSLLGYVRSGDFICYDEDVDIGLMGNEYDAFKRDLKFYLENSSFGERYDMKERGIFGYRQTALFHKETGTHADISEFLFAPDNKIQRNVPALFSLWWLKECQSKYPQEWIVPLKPIYFKDKVLYSPNDPSKLLQCYYGKSFMTPDHICDENCEKCQKVKSYQEQEDVLQSV